MSTKHQFKRVPASSLIPNPMNWRTHPEPQRLALQFMLSQIGDVDVLKVVETDEGLMLLDGHLRADIMGDEDVDVMVLDLDEEQQRLFLAFFDPITMMAGRDKQATQSIIDTLQISDSHMQSMANALIAPTFPQLEPFLPESDFPELPNGEKSAIGQMTFSVTEGQRELIERALSIAKQRGTINNMNANSNGNALTVISEDFLAHAQMP